MINSKLTQIARNPDGSIHGKSGDTIYLGWAALCFSESSAKQFKDVVKVNDNLWVARL